MCRSFRGTDACLSWTCPFVGERELSEVAADHVEFDFDSIEDFAIVDCDLIADHLGHDNAISQMGFDGSWLLTR